jgi:hypothetical protein
MELWIERVVRGGFLEQEEWLETEVDHWMRDLGLSIMLPPERPCRSATLSQRSTGNTTLLPQEHFALLPDGRQKLTWSTRYVKLHDLYTIKWTW